jgi:hypothetical protein
MGKFTDLQDSIFSVFGSQEWAATNIKAVPSNFIPRNVDSEYIRLNILPNTFGINTKSVSGIMIIDIFTSAGNGPNRANLIADTLDDFFVCKVSNIREGVSLQTMQSSLDFVGIDSSNTTLFRAKYTIPFNFFGVE